MIKVLLFSDTHYSPEPDTDSHPLEKAISHANYHHGDADLSIFLGDLVMAGRISEYRAIAVILQRLARPYRLMLGNHDDRDAFSRVFGQHGTNADSYVQTAVNLDNLKFLLLDTNLPGQDRGTVDAGRLKWLEQALATADRPCCICMHHPPAPTFLPAYDAIGLINPHPLIDLMKRYRDRIYQIIHGHCHMPFSGSVSGIPVTGIGAVCNPALPNFKENRFIEHSNGRPVYGVLVSDGQSVAVHTIDCG